MNKVNFDSLKSVKAPQEWLDKAALIPETCVQKRRFTFPIYRVAAVASVVLVSVIGLMVLLFFSDNVPVVAHNGGVAAPESLAVEAVDSETTPSYASVETIAVSSTDAVGNAVVAYREKPAPTVSGAKPTTQQTSDSLASEKTSPTIPSTECPTMPIGADDPIAVPPTDPPSPPETDPTLSDGRFYVTVKKPLPGEGEVPAAIETGDPIVFCRMYDASGDLVGSSNLFAEEKRATVVSINPDDSFVVTYDPLEMGLPISRGRYTYVIIDYYIGTELCRGTVEY